MKKNGYSKLQTLSFIIFTFLSVPAQSETSPEKDLWSRPLKQCWNYQSDSMLANFIASDNDNIFVPYLSGNIKAFNLFNGKILWNTELGGEIISEIAADNKNIYILNKTLQTEEAQIDSRIHASLRALDSNGGITVWKKTLELDSAAHITMSENLLLLNTGGGLVKAFDKQSGAILWEIDIKQPVSAVSISLDTIIFGTTGKKILLVSKIDGSIKKELEIYSVPTNILQLNRELLYFGDNKGFLHSLNISIGSTVWKRRFGGAITSVTDTSRGILATSIDNFVYMVNSSTGKIIWKRRLAARISEKPFIKENIAVVFAFGDLSAYFIELNKGKILNVVTLSDANYFAGNPANVGNILVFPTLHGLYAFSGNCAEK